MNETSSRDVHVHAYKNGKTIEQCRKEAKKYGDILVNRIEFECVPSLDCVYVAFD